MAARTLLIHGWYFMDIPILGGPMFPLPGTQDERCSEMFAGWLHQPHPEEIWTGVMHDGYGPSELRDVEVDESDGELRFTKYYPVRPEPIDYLFVQNGEVWSGRFDYVGTSIEGGAATCLLTPAPLDLVRRPTVIPERS